MLSVRLFLYLFFPQWQWTQLGLGIWGMFHFSRVWHPASGVCLFVKDHRGPNLCQKGENEVLGSTSMFKE